MRLTIKTTNAAFADGDAGLEVARILREVADKLENGATSGAVMDVNGNAVGEWKL